MVTATPAPAAPRDTAPAPAPAPAARKRRSFGRWLLRLLAAALLLIGAAAIACLLWARSDGSLATALRLAGRYVPLQADGVQGAILGSSRIDHLVWDQDGLRVVVDGAQLRWEPAALLHGQVHIQELAAASVAVRVPHSESTEPASAPPAIPALPITIRLDQARVSTFEWAGPPAIALYDIQAAAHADRTGYTVDLQHLGFAQDNYQARVRAQAQVRAGNSPQITASAAGALIAPLAPDKPGLPVTLSARVHGPLTALDTQATIQLVQDARDADAKADATNAADTSASLPSLPELPELPALPAVAAAASSAESSAPQSVRAPPAGLSARARITPWEALPLASADVALQDFNLAALLPTLPRTALSGRAQLQALADRQASAWALQTQLSNASAGPWDAHQLPLDTVTAQMTVAPSGSLQIHTLQAHLAGGTVNAQGDWHAGAAGATSDPSPWAVQMDLADIQPQRILSTLAGPTLGGKAAAAEQSDGAIAFDVALQAQARTARTAHQKGAQTTLDLSTLGLKTASAQGQWKTGQLKLQHLRVETRDAAIQAHGDFDLADLAQAGGNGALQVQAPGLRLAADGKLQPDAGDGTLKLDLSDAARLLAWARTLPGTADALADLAFSGSAALQGTWRGGWRDPRVQATLNTPRFQVAPKIRLRALQAQINGTLARLQLASSGEAQVEEQQIGWKVTADGGRTTPKAPLAASDWKARIAELQVRASNPDLRGAWRADLAAPLALTWSHQHALNVAAGELTLQPPAAVARNAAPATITWGATHWQGSTLTSTGALRHLPLAWADALSGGALTHAGIQGDLVFDGAWDVALGKAQRATIRLARSSGDLSVVANDEASDTEQRVAAGIRAASAELRLAGTQLNATLDWQSTRAGEIEGSVQSQLSALRDRSGHTTWSWGAKAPLVGHIRMQLPSIATWSALAPPGWRLRGALHADVQVAGTRDAPALSGTLDADKLALRSVVNGIFFKRGTLRARFAGTRLFIDEFQLQGAGREAPGSVHATGSAGLIDGKPQAQLHITLDALRALAAQDRQVTLSGKIDAGFDGHTVRADGTITVDKALITLPDNSRPTLASDVVVSGPNRKLFGVASKTDTPTKEGSSGAAGATTGVDANVNVKINLGSDFRLQGLGIDTRLAGELTVLADGPITAMPKVTGKIQTEGGTFHAYGQKLNITQGAIYFSGNATNPGLNVIALRPNFTSDQKAGVQIQGTALLPQVHLYSDPLLGDTETLTWLLLGHGTPENGDEAALMQTAALAMLSGRGGKGLASTLGLDTLGFSPGSSSGAGAEQAASVTVGKRLTDKLYAAYEQSLGGAGSVLMIFYELSRRWLVRGQAGETSALDLIYKLSYE